MKPKIAYMTRYGKIPSRKADGVAVMNTCSGLVSQGFEVELILPHGQATPLATLGGAESIWGFYGVPRNFRITYFPCSLFGLPGRNVRYNILGVAYAVVRGNRLIYSRQIELAYLAALFGRISIFESHNYLRVSQKRILPYWINMLRNPKRPAAMVVTTRAAARAYVMQGVPEERLLVAPNGVDVQRFASTQPKAAFRDALGLPKSKTIVGFSGHLYERRGIEDLFECARLLDQLLFLIVGGEPNDVDRYHSLARHLSISNVKFVGFVPQASLPTYLLACDILVMPYTTATVTHNYMSPMKMFDYLACGRPIVATDFPVVREILHDRRNAILVPPDSGKALSTGIKCLLDHPDFAIELGEQARRDAQQYTWENRTRHIVSWYKELFNV
jgi:glycosyltransferase involved in cell wall biosynthesis